MVTGIYAWQWRLILPVSAALQVAGFLLFFWTVRQHKRAGSNDQAKAGSPEVWMRLVIASSCAFLASLLFNLAAVLCTSFIGSGPALPPSADRHLLLISLWAFLVVSMWGFNARWVPVFLGLPQPNPDGLLIALAILLIGVITGLAGVAIAAGLQLLAASLIAIASLHVFEEAFKHRN